MDATNTVKKNPLVLKKPGSFSQTNSMALQNNPHRPVKHYFLPQKPNTLLLFVMSINSVLYCPAWTSEFLTCTAHNISTGLLKHTLLATHHSSIGAFVNGSSHTTVTMWEFHTCAPFEVLDEWHPFILYFKKLFYRFIQTQILKHISRGNEPQTSESSFWINTDMNVFSFLLF